MHSLIRVGSLKEVYKSYGQVGGSIFSRLKVRASKDDSQVIMNQICDLDVAHGPLLSAILQLIAGMDDDSQSFLYQVDNFVRCSNEKYRVRYEQVFTDALTFIDDQLKESQQSQHVYRLLLPYILYNFGISGTAHFWVGNDGWLLTKLRGGDLAK